MNMKNRHQLALPITVFCLTVVSTLAHGEEFEQHGAHEHGAAKLNLAQEGNNLIIELETPAANVVGFEHPPRTEAQQMAVNKAQTQLQQGERIFLLPAGAKCQLTAATVQGEIFTSPLHDNNMLDGKETLAESTEYHEDEDPNQEQGHHHEEGHSDIDASYQFRCNNIPALTHVDVLLFERFSGFREIQSQVISANGQQAQHLTKDSYRIMF
jgi:hypothetical protein